MRVLTILACLAFFAFMPLDTAGRRCVITREHQLIPEFDTVLVTTYYQTKGRFHVMLKNGRGLWVDDCFELDTLKE